MMSPWAITRTIAVVMCFVFSPLARAESISLAAYLQQVQSNHPFFIQQAFNTDIAQAQQRRFLGDEDWVVKSNPVYQRISRSPSSNIFLAREQHNLALNAGLERNFWRNGGRLSIDYDYYRSDQKYPPPVGSFDEHGNGVSVRYSLPLMKNKGGLLSRLDYDLQAYNIDLSEVDSQEQQEQFLAQQAALFLDWVFVTEQQRIAINRLALAEEELVRTEKKRRSRLLAEVDVLRAQDAVINARQNLSAITSQWRALQVELATQSGDVHLNHKTPQFDLYGLKTVPELDAALNALQHNSRQLKAVDLQIARIAHFQEGLHNQLEPELDLVLGAGLRSESDRLSRSAKFDQPQYLIGLNFRYPLGQRSAKADVSKARLQQQQLNAARESLSWQLEAQLRSVLVQLNELVAVIALNQEQINIAQLRTAEELKRHNQGRSELSFVIQSRDSEQNAQLSYAANAARYQKLWLRYQSLSDLLLP